MSSARDGALDALTEALRPLVSELVGEELGRRLVEGADARRADGSPWLSVSEAAEYLRTSERTVQRLVTRGRVRSSTIGRRRLLHRDDLDSAATREE